MTAIIDRIQSVRNKLDSFENIGRPTKVNIQRIKT
jgi:hypothetical protein